MKWSEARDLLNTIYQLGVQARNYSISHYSKLEYHSFVRFCRQCKWPVKNSRRQMWQISQTNVPEIVCEQVSHVCFYWELNLASGQNIYLELKISRQPSKERRWQFFWHIEKTCRLGGCMFDLIENLSFLMFLKSSQTCLKCKILLRVTINDF